MEYDDYLAHYGVKGMKWGKRKAKPRVLSERKAKKVAKLDQRVADSKSEIRSLREQRKNSNIVKKVGINRKIRKSVERQQRDHFDSTAIKKGKLTMNQRSTVKVAIGIGLIAAPGIASRTNASLHNIADSKRKSDAGRAAASRLADTRGINSFRTIDLSMGADGEWR
jgi:hypothetical protein